jgi:hypothetical protein
MGKKTRLLTGLLAFVGAVAPALAGVKVGDKAPEIQGGKWYNSKGAVSLAKLRGQIVVVDFWATW